MRVVLIDELDALLT